MRSTRKTKSQILKDFELLAGQYAVLKSQYDSFIGKNKEDDFLPRESFFYFIEHAPIAMAVVNMNGTIEYINKKAFNVFGYQISDIETLDKWWSTAYPDEKYRGQVKEQWLGSVSRSMKGDSDVKGNQYWVTCKDGTKKLTFIFQVIVADKILVLFEDLTETNKIKQDLHDSEQHYKMISGLATDYVFKINIGKSGKIDLEFITDNYSSITGRKNHEAGFEAWKNIIHPEDYPKIMDLLKRQMETSLSVQIECRSFLQNNQIRWIQIFSKSEWNELENRVTNIVGAVKDITERKNFEIQLLEKNQAIEMQNKELQRLNAELSKANQELKDAKEKAEESDHLKTAFLQNMSHEIRTPMNAIMGFSSLIADNYNNKTKLQKFADIINTRCNDLLEIINGILDIARIESGQLPMFVEECDLALLFEELSMFYLEHQKRARKEHIHFNIIYTNGEAPQKIIVDRVKLKQILINLISNAFKFTEKGTILCGCKADNENVIFYVSDTGVGIPADKHDLIFKRFMQIGDNKIKTYSGTGLGLSIVKGLIDLMQGNIWLDSIPEDVPNHVEGKTTFYFSLPRQGPKIA